MNSQCLVLYCLFLFLFLSLSLHPSSHSHPFPSLHPSSHSHTHRLPSRSPLSPLFPSRFHSLTHHTPLHKRLAMHAKGGMHIVRNVVEGKESAEEQAELMPEADLVGMVRGWENN